MPYTFGGYANQPPVDDTPGLDPRYALAKSIIEHGQVDPPKPDPLAEVNQSIDAAQGVIFDPVSGATPAMDEVAQEQQRAKASVGDPTVDEALARSESYGAPAMQTASDILSGKIGDIGSRSRASAARAGARTTDAMQTVGEAFKKQQEAQEKLGELRAQKAAEFANIKQANLDAEKQLLARHNEEQAAIEGRVATKQAEIEQRSKEIRERKIDPDAVWKNPDGSQNYGKRIAASIAMALGAFGSALAGGRNTAADIIMKQIDDDMASQRANIDNEKENLSFEQTANDRARQGAREKNADFYADKAQRIDAHLAYLDTINTEYMSEEERINKEQTQAQLEAEKAASMQQFGQQLFANEQNQLAFEQQNTAMQAATQKEAKPLPFLGKSVVATDPAAAQAALSTMDKTQVTQMRESVAALSEVKALAARYKELRAEYGSEHIPSAAGTEMTSIQRRIVDKMRVIGKMGVPQEYELERLEQEVPGSGFDANAIGRLDSLVNSLETGVNASLGEYGLAVQGTSSAAQGIKPRGQ